MESIEIWSLIVSVVWLVTGGLVELSTGETDVESAAVLRVGVTVVVAEPEGSLGCGTGVLSHHGSDTFLPATLTRGGAGQDGRGPDHAGAALPGCRHSVHALHVLIAQLRLRRVEVSVTAGTPGSGLWLLQLRPLSALNKTRSAKW